MILLAGLKAKKKVKKSSPGQMRLPWDEWEATNEEIENVAW
jgi:putative transposase